MEQVPSQYLIPPVSPPNVNISEMSGVASSCEWNKSPPNTQSPLPTPHSPSLPSQYLIPPVSPPNTSFPQSPLPTPHSPSLPSQHLIPPVSPPNTSFPLSPPNTSFPQSPLPTPHSPSFPSQHLIPPVSPPNISFPQYTSTAPTSLGPCKNSRPPTVILRPHPPPTIMHKEMLDTPEG